MKKFTVSAFIVSVILVLPHEVKLQSVSTDDDSDLLAQHGEISVRVSLSSPLDLSPCRAAASWRWGAEDSCPPTSVVAMEVKVSGKPIFIPLSAFCDLGDPGTVRIEPRTAKNCFAIVLRGGDAAVSYSATFEFVNNLLSERLVQHGEFPRRAWEKTIYKFNVEEEDVKAPDAKSR